MPRMRRLIRRLPWAVAFVAAASVMVACGSGSATVGPLTLEVPEGWLITDREPNTIKVTNGTIGSETSTKPGTATAVFDVYVESDQTLKQFNGVLRENNVKAEQERFEIDGFDATVVSYETTSFGPATEVVFVPEWDVRIVYRAAYGDQEAAFVRHRAEFREALESIRFEDRRKAPA